MCFSLDRRLLTIGKARGHGLKSVTEYGQDIRKQNPSNPEVLGRSENGQTRTDLNGNLVLEPSFLGTCSKAPGVIKRVKDWDFFIS